jgi:hypothetical protein
LFKPFALRIVYICKGRESGVDLMKRLFSYVGPAAALAAALYLVPAPAMAGGYASVSFLPEFLFHIEGTSAYFLPDTTADIFFYSGQWYRRSSRGWAVSLTYGGPWGFVSIGNVPEVLVRLPVDYRVRRRYGPVPYRVVVTPPPPRYYRPYYKPYYYKPYYRSPKYRTRHKAWRGYRYEDRDNIRDHDHDRRNRGKRGRGRDGR